MLGIVDGLLGGVSPQFGFYGSGPDSSIEHVGYGTRVEPSSPTQAPVAGLMYASKYTPDLDDSIDVELIQQLRRCEEIDLTRFPLARIGSGSYILGDRNVRVFSSVANKQKLMAQELCGRGGGSFGSEVALDVYLQQTGHILSSLAGEKASVIARMPVDRRLTFENTPGAPTLKCDSGADRVNAMHIACKQARLREQAAEMYGTGTCEEPIPLSPPVMPRRRVATAKEPEVEQTLTLLNHWQTLDSNRHAQTEPTSIAPPEQTAIAQQISQSAQPDFALLPPRQTSFGLLPPRPGPGPGRPPPLLISPTNGQQRTISPSPSRSSFGSPTMSPHRASSSGGVSRPIPRAPSGLSGSASGCLSPTSISAPPGSPLIAPRGSSISAPPGGPTSAPFGSSNSAPTGRSLSRTNSASPKQPLASQPQRHELLQSRTPSPNHFSVHPSTSGRMSPQVFSASSAAATSPSSAHIMASLGLSPFAVTPHMSHSVGIAPSCLGETISARSMTPTPPQTRRPTQDNAKLRALSLGALPSAF